MIFTFLLFHTRTAAAVAAIRTTEENRTVKPQRLSRIRENFFYCSICALVIFLISRFLSLFRVYTDFCVVYVCHSCSFVYIFLTFVFCSRSNFILVPEHNIHTIFLNHAFIVSCTVYLGWKNKTLLPSMALNWDAAEEKKHIYTTSKATKN